MKLCSNCRHVNHQQDRRCMHPDLSIKTTDYWTGKSHRIHPTYQEARMLTNCGREGKLWEPEELGFGEYDEKQT